MAEKKWMDLPWSHVPPVMQKVKAKEEIVHLQISEGAGYWHLNGNLKLNTIYCPEQNSLLPIPILMLKF